MVKTLKASYQFNIKKGSVSKTWTLDLKKGSGSLIEGKGAKKADCILTLKDGDFMDLLSGKKKAPQLFMKGKLKLK